VITSNTSSTPEVAGDAALLVDPHDVDAIKNAIVTVCRDDGLCEDLRRRGRKQAEKFSLDAYRERMTALYASLT
jgi:glycosyltransferase involved in cell wall biosynthesis